MALPNYISLSRHNVYYFRYPLPKDLHPESKTSHVRLSLRTSNQREAMVTANMLSYHAETILKTLRKTQMNYEQIRIKIKEGLNQLVEDGRTVRLKSGAMSKHDRQTMQEWLDQFQSYNVEDYYEGDIIAATSEGKISELFPDLDLAPEQSEQFNKEFIRQYPEALKTLIAFNDNPEDIQFNGSIEQTLETRTPLADTIKSYIEESIRGNLWKPHTASQRKMHLETLQTILGDQFIVETLNKAHARTVQEIVSKLPVDWKNNKKTTGMTIKKAVEVEDVKRISVKTSNEYLGAYITFGKWLIDRGHIDKNPFEGMKTRQGGKRKAENPRLAYTAQQMQQIVSGLEDDKIKNGRKQFRYWGVLIASYTGARLEEIAQLHLSDIKEQDDIVYFDINDDGENKELKTESSKRIIPIHQNLIDKGLLKHIQKLKDNGHERLFPDLKYTQKHGYGRNLSEWYRNTYLPSLGFKEKGMDFHSFRHTVATELGEAGVQEALQKRILGHSMANDITAGYDKSTRLGLMKEALEELPY